MYPNHVMDLRHRLISDMATNDRNSEYALQGTPAEYDDWSIAEHGGIDTLTDLLAAWRSMFAAEMEA